MANYRYLAYDSGGRKIAHSVAANSPEEVKKWLWQEGLFIVDIRRPRYRLPSLPAVEGQRITRRDLQRRLVRCNQSSSFGCVLL